MSKGVVLFIVLIVSVSLAYSISIKELLARYSFAASSAQINVIGYNDFMADSNGNGINDSLIIEVSTDNTNGTYTFVVNLLDKNGIITNQSTKTLGNGLNKLNISFSSIYFSQNQFNYSIKVYNSTNNLKYREDNILTNAYQNYEQGFEIINAADSRVEKTLQINLTINSSINGSFEIIVTLTFNNSFIVSKENKTITSGMQDLIINFHNETIKRTHHVGAFNISSVKIGKKLIRLNTETNFYDFSDFAAASYIESFSDAGVDTNNDNKSNVLLVNAGINSLEEGQYTIILSLYDLFNNLVETRNVSQFLNAGHQNVNVMFNGSGIYSKKLNGPFVVKNAELFNNDFLADKMNDAYTTNYYSFNDFDVPNLADLIVEIAVSDSHHYGINNLTANVSFKNIGSKPAFYIFHEIFDNLSLFKSNVTNVLNVGSQLKFQIGYYNISDFVINAIIDVPDFVEELDESNNAYSITIKLNEKPVLIPLNNITATENDLIVVNLTAFDPNQDELLYSINFSKFQNSSNIFVWNTTLNDSGNYELKATASDGFLNDSSVFKITIIDLLQNDIDNDGIDDSIDPLIGDPSFINASNLILTMTVNDSSDLFVIFNGTKRIRFFDNNKIVLEFDFNFSKYRLNLSNILMNKQSNNSKGSLLVKGLAEPQIKTKTLHIDRTNSTMDGICIKDIQISKIGDISNKCNAKNELKVRCTGRLTRQYKCTYNSTINKYKVEGLKNSGVIQIKY